jgi:hypothetical protein
MNQDQQRKRRNPTQTTPDDDEAQEVDVTGAETQESPRRGTQVAAESDDAEFDDEDAATDEDDADDEEDESPIGGRV